MYIDPGAGSVALQLIAAGALSVVVMVGRVREAVKSFFGSLLLRLRRGGAADKH